ncbi:hypothetical protein IQ03_04801 [Gemmobacter caeni]|uniref:Uncharacterized protein n=1 Tax=Gemmobacter caeni TaxID=589035 RepID=A0A2T6AZ63_9RHOB|nr:hypothetical protein [Gemmobacter caeni]PTX49105.1 hypothetical protein C8N34_108215 [Gemmobacter caeni]TWI93442.1 hypothetical protein IQ03_04801 [Gemmobacter caeni]
MKTSVTNKFTTGHYGLRDTFDIPEGTPVIFGAPDCEGKPFPHWTLSVETAAQLSGNLHDSAHRFVVVHPDHVTPADGDGYAAQLAYSRSQLPTLAEVRSKARREKREIVERVLMANDSVACIKAGPRGGLKILGRF